LLAALAWVPRDLLDGLARGLLAQRSLVVMLLLFALLSLSLIWSQGQKLDAWLFLRINLRGGHTRHLDETMIVATFLGNGLSALAVAVGAFLAGAWRMGVEILLGIVTLWLIVETIKALAARKRPFRLFYEARVVGWRERGASFPSGHTSQAFFMASLLSHHFGFNLWATLLIHGLAALVGFTRIYLGAHYPRDVLGGVILGWVWGAVGALADQAWMRG
jgi:membrane-associated phospholipid phosphatase